jgi:hypothetical protein
MKQFSLLLALVLVATMVSWAQAPENYPQPRPGPLSRTDDLVNQVTTIVTPQGNFPAQDPFANPPGSNFLTTVWADMHDGNGADMPNTLPSTPNVYYNLLVGGGAKSVTPIDPTSPRDDLSNALQTILTNAQNGSVDQTNIQFALNILEGNPIPSRPTYSGFALLHYTGPERIKAVDGPTANVNVHQIWFDNHIESDTAMIDPTAVLTVPWTVTYTIDVLRHGADDFAPYVMYFDAPKSISPWVNGPPHFGIDATFFPMNEGTRVVLVLKMAPAMYFNLTYSWGWRMHPPRVQVMENALKTAAVTNIPGATTPQTLANWEINTFGPAPRSSRAAQLAAIAQIGELAPEKRMWQDLNAAKTASTSQVVTLMQDALLSFDDWSDRTHLPRGVTADQNSDATLLYVNNTIYAGSPTYTLPNFPTLPDFPKWTIRPQLYKVTLLNGDHFVHAYVNVDFGGRRGWANIFQSSLGVGDLPINPLTGLPGTGCLFTFGRNHWWMNAGGPNPAFGGGIGVPVASTDGMTPGFWKVNMTLNFEPNRRLRLYQFDAFHHDVAVYSLH